MSDNVFMIKSTVSISKENSMKIMKTLSKYAKKNQLEFINEYSLKNYCDNNYFYAVMELLRYPVEEIDDKYIITSFSGRTLGSDFEVFLLISEFIDNGYIEMNSEQKGRWRWVFKDGTVFWEFPQMVWKETL